MTYVRPSSLGCAEFCPRSADLNEQSGISRSAIISTAWHAKLAGNDTLIGELHPDERKELAGYGVPTDTACGSVALVWAEASKEVPVQLWEGDKLITEGTLDAAWVVELPDGRRWAFVSDNKRSTWAIPDGPDCLQVAAYGHGFAVKNSCVGYTPGLWSGTDSEWSWGTPVDLTSPDALDLYLRIKRASRNDHRLKSKPDDQRYVTGAHCNACYGRMKCREYLLPAWGYLAKSAAGVDTTEELRVNFTVAADTAAELLLHAKAMEDYSNLIKEQVKVFAERGGVVKDPATGKVYLPTVCKGRLGLDKEAALKAGFDVEKYQTRGKPYSQFSWKRQ